MKRLWMIALLAVTILAGSMIAACGDDDDDDAGDDGGEEYTAEQQDAVDYINSLATLFNSDTEAFVAEFTDAGIAEYLGDTETPPDELRAQAVDFLAGEQVEIVEFASVEATESDATVNTITAGHNVLNDETFVLIEESTDNFQVNGYSSTTPQIPDGVATLEVEAVEFGYRFEAPESADFALVLNNAGEQAHQVVLVQVADDAPELDQLVEIALGVEDPTTLPPEFVADAGDVFAPPGESATMVFNNPLPAGRYMMICFVPDETQSTETEDGPPHATLGMYAEFTTE